MHNVKIGKKLIGKNRPCFIIAEASSNHGGSLRRAIKMIKTAADAGADAIKFQVFKAETIAADTTKALIKNKTFVKKGTKLIDVYKANELPRIWLKALKDYADKCGIIFLATPFDLEAVDKLKQIKVAAYKIASYEMLDVLLLRKAAKTGKPIILSTGMADLKEIKAAIEVIKKAGNNQIILLHCRSSYPLPANQVNLKAMETMRAKFKLPVGFSDHSLGINIPIAAAALEARVIEKHFCLEKSQTIDAKFSLEPRELKQMITGIREIEAALGSKTKSPSKAEKKERKYRRSLWVVKRIKKGEKLNNQNIKSLRPALGISPLMIDRVLGKKVKQDLERYTPLKSKHY